jgi:hypothetical protein
MQDGDQQQPGWLAGWLAEVDQPPVTVADARAERLASVSRAR